MTEEQNNKLINASEAIENIISEVRSLAMHTESTVEKTLLDNVMWHLTRADGSLEIIVNG